MRLAGRLAQIIEREKPDLVVLDVTNEHGALDRLHELGYSKRLVKGVHFGEQAVDKTRHRNMRVQMHADLREWFNDPDVSIPNDQKFLTQIGAVPKEKETSNNVMYLVPKDEITDALRFSPNDLDSAILTFAFPVRRRFPQGESGRAGHVNKIKTDFKSNLKSFKKK